MSELEQKLIEAKTRNRFWIKVLIDDGCWEWTSNINPRTGYPNFWIGNKMLRGNRVAFYLSKGYWPNTCRHTCDNKKCVRPDHLIDGSTQDNVNDRVARNRSATKENNGNAILTQSIVDSIRKDYVPWKNSYTKLAAKYEVSRSVISQIVNRKTWK